MKTETFDELLGSMKEALEHAEAKRDLRTTTMPRPPAPLDGRAVKRAREALHASQAVFAGYLNVSTKLVQAWEAGRRVPEGPALVLLHIAAEQPELIEVIRHQAHAAKRRVTKDTSRSRRRGSDIAKRHAAAVR